MIFRELEEKNPQIYVLMNVINHHIDMYIRRDNILKKRAITSVNRPYFVRYQCQIGTSDVRIDIELINNKIQIDFCFELTSAPEKLDVIHFLQYLDTLDEQSLLTTIKSYENKRH